MQTQCYEEGKPAPLGEVPSQLSIKDSGLPASNPCHAPDIQAQAFRWFQPSF